MGLRKDAKLGDVLSNMSGKGPPFHQACHSKKMWFTNNVLNLQENCTSKPLKVTENCTRLSFARICVEIDFDALLPSTFDFQVSADKVV